MSAEYLCLGRIKSIEKFHIDVSLPHSSIGRVRIADINSNYRQALEKLISGDSEENVHMLHEMFYVGQILRCSVKGGSSLSESLSSDAWKKKIVELSIDPEVVNRNLKKSQLKPNISFVGSICSMEDKGYIINTGIRNLQAFLPSNEVVTKENVQLSVGSLVCIRLLSKNTDDNDKKASRVLRVTMNITENGYPLVLDNSPIAFDCLLPGMLLNVKVRANAKSSLVGVFQSCNVSIPASHCTEDLDNFQKNTLKTLCITSLDLVTKEITGSLLPHFISNTIELKEVKLVQVGTRFKNATVERIRSNIVYLNIHVEDNIQAVLMKNQAFDDKAPKQWTSHFPIGKEIACRVVDFDLFENVAIVSCRKAIIESPFMSLDDVKGGTNVTATVQKFSKDGVVVRIGGKLRGLIPFMHLSDVAIKQPQDRYNVGDQLKTCIISVDPENQKLILTAKQSLINPSQPLLGSGKCFKAWEALLEAKKEDPKVTKQLIVTTFVVHVSDKGVLVSGVNNVRGWMPKRETFACNSPTIDEFFLKGQTIQCRVLKYFDNNKSDDKTRKPSSQFLLSQKIDPTETNLPEEFTISSPITIGEIYYCIIKKVDDKGLLVDLVKKPKIKLASVCEAFLPYEHLSDSVRITALIKHSSNSLFQVGRLLSKQDEDACRVVVVTISANQVIVSAKQSLVTAASSKTDEISQPGHSMFVRAFNQLTVGSQWFGWIAHHKDYGIFVQFPGYLRGLAPIRYLADRRAPEDIDWTLIYPTGATVEAKVVEVGLPDKKRCLLSLRMLDIYVSAAHQHVVTAVKFAQQCLADSQWLCTQVQKFQPFSNFSMGDEVEMTIVNVTEEMVIGTVSSGCSPQAVPAAAFLANTTDVKCNVGIKYPGVITLVNLEAMRIEVCLAPWLLQAFQNRSTDSKSMQVHAGQSISSTVLSLGNTRDIVIVGLKHHGAGRMAVLPARRCFNDVLGGNSWELGQVNRVTIQGELKSSDNSHQHPLLATLTMYDPLGKSKQNKTTPSIMGGLTTIPTVSLKAGTILPHVVFQGVKGRMAYFRLPNTRGLGDLVRLYCRLIDMVHTAKAARKFMKSPPDHGTVFKDVLVIRSSDQDDRVSTKRLRLPLSNQLAQISIIGKEPLKVGDLICGQYFGATPLCWRLILPRCGRGELYVSCMSHLSDENSAECVGSASTKVYMPHHPKKGTFVTCRVIGKSSDAAPSSQFGNDKRGKKKNIVGGDIAIGDKIIAVDSVKNTDKPRKTETIYYVSTKVADIRQWQPDKYKTIELELEKVYTGYIKMRTKNSLIVSLSYDVEVSVPFTSPSLRKQLGISSTRYHIGTPVEVIMSSLKTLTGRLVGEPILNNDTAQLGPVGDQSAAVEPVAKGRKRTASTSESLSPLKRRKRLSCSISAEEELQSDDKTNILSRFADFLPPTEMEIDTPQIVTSETTLTEANSPKNSDLETAPAMSSMEKETRLATVAQATSNPGGDVLSKLPYGFHLSSMEEFEIAVKNAPGNTQLWTLYAAFHLAKNEIQKARAVLDRALRASPSSFSPVESSVFSGNLLLAALNLEIKLASIPSNPVTTNACKKTSRLDEVISKISQLEKEVVTRKAIEALSNGGLHSNAEDLAKKLVKMNATNPDCWLSLVKARFRAGKLAAAREAQRNAGRILRVVHIPHFAAGSARLEFEFGDVDRAMSLFDEQLVAHPQRKALYQDYLNLLISAKKTSQAQVVREKALEKLPSKCHDSINKLFPDWCETLE